MHYINYFSVVSITTVGYGDVVVRGGNSLPKLFILCFNVYAVCISVSALGVIAKLALNQEKKIVTRAKERARQQLINMFSSKRDEDDEYDEKEDEEDDEEEDDEQCSWANRVLEKKDDCDMPNDPQTVFGALIQAFRKNAFNFIILGFLAIIIQKAEGWSLIDVLYFWNCTATTIGFGDLCPQSQLGRLVAIVFVPLSVVTLGEVIAGVFGFVDQWSHSCQGREGFPTTRNYIFRPTIPR